MANTIHEYDTSIGTKERSAVAATKLRAIVIGLIALLGVISWQCFLTDPSGVPVIR